VAFALVHLQPVDEADDLGAAGLQIGLELSAPNQTPSDLPPGPDADASAASPAQVEQKAVLKETDLPKDTPTESPDPDRVVSPNNTNKPVDENAETATAETHASVESAAVEASAVPSADNIPQNMLSTTIEQGSGASKQRIRTTWQKELAALFDRHKRYPQDRSQRAAEVVVNFTLDRAGHVISTSIVKSSGDVAFDEAAMQMIKQSDPVPPPPPVIADDGLSFTLPVIFRIKHKG
jgi:TonB family protein